MRQDENMDGILNIDNLPSCEKKSVSGGSRSQARCVEPHKPAFDTGSTFIFLVILTKEIKLFNDDM